MLPIDLPPARRRTLIIVSLLLALNGGLAQRLYSQIQERPTDATIALVKDDSVSLKDASKLVTTTISNQITAHAEDRPTITTYTVQSGDTLSSIAAKFDVSVNTVRWANDLTTKTSTIKPGMELTILPVSGVEYKVKKGDTLSGIAIKFDANQEDILAYNDIDVASIKVGMELVIPYAQPIAAPLPKEIEKPAPAKTPAKTSIKATEPAKGAIKTADTSEKEVATIKTPVASLSVTTHDDTDTPKNVSATYGNPISAILTQGIHDSNGVDFGAPIGTTIRSSADGKVIIAKDSGFNGGYGNYIVITHADGSQTLYAHLSQVSVSVGDSVNKGETIGLSGNSGRSTGPHLHYKIINGTKNPFAALKIGTKI